MQTVYRVERADNRTGPYHWGSFFEGKYTHTAKTGRPGPNDVGEPWDLHGLSWLEGKQWVFGFQSPELLAIWFDNCLDELLNEGFIIATYEVPDDLVLHGNCQSCFCEEYHEQYDVG